MTAAIGVTVALIIPLVRYLRKRHLRIRDHVQNYSHIQNPPDMRRRIL